MFDIRRREEAEGERRMMGSGRRAWWEGFLRRETREAFVAVLAAVMAAVVEGACLEGRARERNVSAILRTWEKSWGGKG